MVSHECRICNKKFVRKADLIYHMEKKKKPCVSIGSSNFISNSDLQDDNELKNILINFNSKSNSNNNINTDKNFIFDIKQDDNELNPIIPLCSNYIISTNSDISSDGVEIIDVGTDIITDIGTDVGTDIITDTNTSVDSNSILGSNENKCEYCLKCFSTKYNLNKHIKTVCKSNTNRPSYKIQTQTQTQIPIQTLIEQNEQLQKMLIEESIEHKKQTDELHKMMMNLIKKETSKRSKKVKINNLNNGVINTNTTNTTNTSTTNTNNGTINNNIIIQFGKEDLSQIDNKHFINLIKSNSTGAKIITDIVKMIHFNEDCPQFQNICMTDLNRGRVVMYDGVKWNTITNGDKIIPDLIEKAVNYSNAKDNQLRERFLQNPKVLGRMDVIKKYTDKCDVEQLEELKEEQYYEEADNKDKIADCEQFIELVENRVKELIYNEKDKVLKKKNDLISKNQIFSNPNVVIT